MIMPRYLDSLSIAIGLLFKCRIGSTVLKISCWGGITNAEDLDGLIIKKLLLHHRCCLVSSEFMFDNREYLEVSASSRQVSSANNLGVLFIAFGRSLMNSKKSKRDLVLNFGLHLKRWVIVMNLHR